MRGDSARRKPRPGVEAIALATLQRGRERATYVARRYVACLDSEVQPKRTVAADAVFGSSRLSACPMSSRYPQLSKAAG